MSLNLRIAVEMAGNVSTKNSKMPGSSTPTDPFVCQRGSVLRAVPGSTCSSCYAIRLAKYRANVAQGWAKNQARIDDAPREDWIAGQAFQIQRAADKSGQSFHRWYDAGDLQSVENLDRIAAVCRKTPTIKHWLPTREIQIVRDWLAAGNKMPRNLIIRLSSAMIDGKPLLTTAKALGAGIACSTVHAKTAPIGHVCPASKQGNACLDCRACWNRRVPNVSYHKH